ncbi:3-isopropylmalate dehydratase small subunit [candidate division KSB1 bacterium]|nr:3-isopropylmalate dehydratase small subunit [candidate division KSB1 bacterium]NIR72842.1 3-isopropylmalate dehydratase small subunit [candidate division KSB1 bacterium]NIS26882.1 3-isopropylmalate dehydratase small subunit [candidate division KSB1 bacterium]NIT73678.1 3-isopropylmalate dehydratase small subunit [candidate division KSB1 bacterium]NIU27549.1 3-isopropylmalate dehydratase small subunit [candidate division KSB1 bacterium]
MKGRVHKYGDNIDTDVIIPARHCVSIKEEDLAEHCLEDLDKEFVNKVKPGDVLMAGNNFGCGSSRENAPIAIKGAKVGCVVARYFARIFYRNAINIGLPIFECPEAVDGTDAGDTLEIDLKTGTICNQTKDKTFKAAPFPETMQEIINVGGMVNYVRKRIGK